MCIMYICIVYCVYAYMHTCNCIYIYICTYTHTYIYIYIYMWLVKKATESALPLGELDIQ